MGQWWIYCTLWSLWQTKMHLTTTWGTWIELYSTGKYWTGCLSEKCTKNVLALEDKLFYKFNMPSCQGNLITENPLRCYYCLCASFTIADSESSSSSGEDEIYHKSKTHNKTEVRVFYQNIVGERYTKNHFKNCPHWPEQSILWRYWDTIVI